MDPDQWWFWTPEWQAGEREVDEELAQDGYEVFETAEDFIASLERFDGAPRPSS